MPRVSRMNVPPTRARAFTVVRERAPDARFHLEGSLEELYTDRVVHVDFQQRDIKPNFSTEINYTDQETKLTKFLQTRGLGSRDTERIVSLVRDFSHQEGYRFARASTATDVKYGAGSGARDISPLPEKAPAFWAEAKQPGDTPPDFIKRHYGKWLRSDGLGLARADIGRLDLSLYTSLANFLRKNTLPDDCPLPKKSEVVDKWVERVGAARSDMDSDDLRNVRHAKRLEAAIHRRRGMQKI